jgi:hypothetical protein
MASQVKVGTVTGTGAIINVSLGWVPDFLVIFNATDGDLVGLWANGMTADTNVDIAAAAITNAAGGISTYAGTAALQAGFSLGTDYSESAKVYYYMAVRNLP